MLSFRRRPESSVVKTLDAGSRRHDKDQGAMSVLICGSLAYDTIMGSPRRFASTARWRGERPAAAGRRGPGF